jgi:outer membrane protein assembly factor BamB
MMRTHVGFWWRQRGRTRASGARCLASLAGATLCLTTCSRDADTAPTVRLTTRPNEAWNVPMPGGMDREVDSFPLVTESLLIFVASNGSLVATRRNDGSTAWIARGRWRNTTDVVRAGDAIVVASDTVVAFDLATGVRRWQFWSGASAADCRPSANASTVFACGRDWRVIALDAASGAVKWTTALRDSLAGVPTLVGTAISGDTVYATVRQKYSESNGFTVGLVFGLAASDGRVIVKMKDGDYTDFTGYVGAPVVAGQLLILSHTIDNKLTALDRFTGRVAWRVRGDPGWVGFLYPAVVRGATLYAASGDRRVYAISVATGGVLWKSVVLDGSQFAAEVCGPFVVSWAGLRTVVLDRSTGRQLSGLDDGLGAGFSFTTPPVSADSDLFVMSVREVRRFTC